MLHHAEDGISRDSVEEIIFGDRELEDIHHATRSVIYNAKKKLKASPLPDVDYMKLTKGILRWTPDIAVEEDAITISYMDKAVKKQAKVQKDNIALIRLSVKI